MHNERSDFGVIAAAFLAGALSGALAGLLLAPKSGRETREDLRGIADDLGDKAGQLAEVVKGKAGDVAERAGEAVQAGVRTYREARTTTETSSAKS